MTDAGWTDLNGQVVHVHSASLNDNLERHGPLRCRGISFMFPMDEEPVVIPIVGLVALEGENKTQELKFISLLQTLRRGKARRFRNWKVKMQVKVKMIVEDCPRYQELWAECQQLMAELQVVHQFVSLRRKKSMTANESLVDKKAAHAARLQYGTREFRGTAWLDETIMADIRKQPFLPGFKETLESIESQLGWRVPEEVQITYAKLGFPFPPSINFDDDDEDDKDSKDDSEETVSQGKRPSISDSDHPPSKKTRSD